MNKVKTKNVKYQMLLSSQIGAANPRLQKVLDALDAIKNKVKSTELVKYRFAENKRARTVCAEQLKSVGN